MFARKHFLTVALCVSASIWCGHAYGTWDYQVYGRAWAAPYDYGRFDPWPELTINQWDGPKEFALDTGWRVGDYPGGQTQARAIAAADLSTGELRVFASALGGPYPWFSSVDGSAYFRDYLTFHLPDGMTAADVTVKIHVSGAYDIANLVAGSSGAFAGLGLGSLYTTEQEGTIYEGWNGTGRGLPLDLSLTGTVADGGRYAVWANLSASFSVKDSLSYFDMANTGRVSIELPEGVWFESGSGEFLRDSIPEPSSLAMLGIGAIGMLACGWRRRKAA